MWSGLVDGHSNFIETGDLKNPLAGVIMNIVVIESWHHLAKDYDVMELDAISREVVTVYSDFLVWSRLSTFNFQAWQIVIGKEKVIVDPATKRRSWPSRIRPY